MAPGAGETVIIETLAHMFADLPPGCKARMVVTEQNQQMVTELQSRVEKRMDPKFVARLGFVQEAQQDGWHQKSQERVAE
eukprot:7731258-Karenia_brevis.AAC.1